jgi:hypothetical protein
LLSPQHTSIVLRAMFVFQRQSDCTVGVKKLKVAAVFDKGGCAPVNTQLFF